MSATVTRDPLARFLEVASDLYRDNPAYRAELDAERRGDETQPVRHPSTVDRLDELDWLVRNGMTPAYAAEQVGWSLETAQTTAIRWSHPVRDRITSEAETGASASWAREWLSAHGVRHAA